MRLADAQRIERCEYRGGEIIASGVWQEIAVAIAGVIEGKRAASSAEMIELRPPYALVRADPVKENDGGQSATAFRTRGPIPQRQMLPIAWICSGSGFGLDFSRAASAMIIPGSQ